LLRRIAWPAHFSNTAISLRTNVVVHFKRATRTPGCTNSPKPYSNTILKSKILKMGTPQLPIDPLLPEIVRCIESSTITLLQAEAGAGKTTRLPPALLRTGFEHIYVLEPRRLAARFAARRVAAELGERVGDVSDTKSVSRKLAATGQNCGF